MVLLLVSIVVLHLVTLAMLFIATLEKVGRLQPRSSGFHRIHQLFIGIHQFFLFRLLGSVVLVGLVQC